MSKNREEASGDEELAFERRDDMLSEEETLAAARERVGDVEQVSRVDQKGKPGNETNDSFVKNQKKVVRGGGYIGTSGGGNTDNREEKI